MNLELVTAAFESAQTSGAWIAPLTSLITAFVLGQIVAWTYERTYRGLSYSRGFSHTLVLVAIAAALLVLSMRHSLIAGLGLFGVLSMIRFRTDLKTPRDLVFVMGAACVGVATGVMAWLVALLGAVIFCAAAIYLAIGPFGSRTRFDGVLRFNVPVDRDRGEHALDQLLREFCRRSVLLSSSDADAGRSIECVYQVKFYRAVDRNELLALLRNEIQAQDTRLMLQDATSEY